MGNPLSPRTGGHEYMWHCHILEHDMIVAAGGQVIRPPS
jgi:FtsP/CotA-like multicopper oxidase with cupredoxin domain